MTEDLHPSCHDGTPMADPVPITVEWLLQIDSVMALANFIRAADQLADAYSRYWARDEKFYAYQDAREAMKYVP